MSLQKPRLVDFTTEGVLMCGLVHTPQSMEENLAQGRAVT